MDSMTKSKAVHAPFIQLNVITRQVLDSTCTPLSGIGVESSVKKRSKKEAV